jgi:hypothetical protein
MEADEPSRVDVRQRRAAIRELLRGERAELLA